MTRTPEQIQQEIDAFESQFAHTVIPPGTPNRRALQRQADADRLARATTPENVARRLALLAELRKARRSAAARDRAAALAVDPVHQVRQWVYRHLRKMGFRRETRSGSGSAYYRLGDLTVRVSDHEVPETEARMESRMSGGWTWANNRYSLDQITTRFAAARWLVEIRREVRSREVCHA